jgi:hypothetical protein
LIGAALVALLVAVVVFAMARPETFWSLDGASLQTSIEDEFATRSRTVYRPAPTRGGAIPRCCGWA